MSNSFVLCEEIIILLVVKNPLLLFQGKTLFNVRAQIGIPRVEYFSLLNKNEYYPLQLYALKSQSILRVPKAINNLLILGPNRSCLNAKLAKSP